MRKSRFLNFLTSSDNFLSFCFFLGVCGQAAGIKMGGAGISSSGPSLFTIVQVFLCVPKENQALLIF